MSKEPIPKIRGSPPPGESSRRFSLASMIIGGITLLTLICMAAYALVVLPVRRGQAVSQLTEIAAQYTQVALANAQTQTASAPTATPSPTTTLTPTSSPTQVIAQATSTPALTATVGPRTATVAALLTQEGQQTQTMTPASGWLPGPVTATVDFSLTQAAQSTPTQVATVGIPTLTPTPLPTRPATQTPLTTVIPTAGAQLTPTPLETSTPGPATATVAALQTQAAILRLTPSAVPTSTALPNTGGPQTIETISENRQVEVTWRDRILQSDPGFIRLSLVLAPTQTPPAPPEDSTNTPAVQETSTPTRTPPPGYEIETVAEIEILDLYETHTIYAVANLESAGFGLNSSKELPLSRGEAITFDWTLPHDASPGTYQVALSLRLRYEPKAGGQPEEKFLWSDTLEVEVTTILGLSGPAAQWVGGIGSVLGSVLASPLIKEITETLGKFLFKSLKPKQREDDDEADEAFASKQSIALRRLLDRRFGLDDLRTFCFELGIDYESLGGEGKSGKIREFVRYVDRRNRIPDVIKIGKDLRPDIPWDEIL